MWIGVLALLGTFIAEARAKRSPATTPDGLLLRHGALRAREQQDVSEANF
jgi:hypothetical protein